MQTINIHAARTQLSRLVDEATAGEEIIIARAGKPVAKLVALGKVAPAGKRVLGRLAGKLTVPADFGAPLPDEVLKRVKGVDAPSARYAHPALGLGRYGTPGQHHATTLAEQGERGAVQRREHLGDRHQDRPRAADFGVPPRRSRRPQSTPVSWNCQSVPPPLRARGSPAHHRDPFDRLLVASHDRTGSALRGGSPVAALFRVGAARRVGYAECGSRRLTAISCSPARTCARS